MKVTAVISDEKREVFIETTDTGVSATIDGRPVQLEVSEPEPGIYLLKSEGRVFEAAVSRVDSGFEVTLRGHTYHINIIDPKRLRGAGVDAEHASGRVEIKTSMPGKVVRVLAAAGDEVQKGQAVVVVEAMKMQNEMKSPKAGIIAEIKAAEGDTVSGGDVLVVIE